MLMDKLMKPYRIILICVALTAIAMTADAQLRIIPEGKVMSVADPRLSPDSVALAFETRHIQAGTLNEDDAPSTYVFRFTNISDSPLHIDRLVTTCSCATASTDKREVPSGESAQISVRYDPKGHPGRFERRIFVYTSNGTDPSAVLKLTVNVENGSDLSGLWPVQMGNIRLRRSEVVFRKGEKASESLRFINLGGKPLRLQCEEAFLPECLSFRTEPEVIEDGMEGVIVIGYDPSVSSQQSVAKVILKGLGVPPSRSSVTVRIEP